jgi:hypothetical protein
MKIFNELNLQLKTINCRYIARTLSTSFHLDNKYQFQANFDYEFMENGDLS